MTHLDNQLDDAEQAASEWVLFWFCALIVMAAMLGLLGCNHPVIPDSSPMKPIGGAVANVQAVKTAIGDAKPHADDTGKALIVVAEKHADNAIVDISAVEDGTRKLQAANGELAGRLSDAQKDFARVTAEKKAADEKYDSAWIGGKTWFWGKVILWSYLGLQVLSAFAGGMGAGGWVGRIACFLINLLPVGNLAAVGARFINGSGVVPAITGKITEGK